MHMQTALLNLVNLQQGLVRSPLGCVQCNCHNVTIKGQFTDRLSYYHIVLYSVHMSPATKPVGLFLSASLYVSKRGAY